MFKAFIALLFLVFVGAVVYGMQGTGYSVTITVKDGKPVISNCTKVPGLSTYLAKLNRQNKASNIECTSGGHLTTTSTKIHCEVVNGPLTADVYWAETLAECNSIKNATGIK